MPPVPRRDWTPPSRRRVLAIRDRLRLVYGRPSAPPHRRPLDELILTVLSQSTNDRNRDVAFLRLRARFGSWSDVRDAPTDEVEAAIRPGGISKVKSARIQAILRALDDPPSLDHLADLDVATARDELCALPGVGRKTAACVLLFAFGMPDVPVDTHVSRVGTRLGLFRPGAPFEELHDDMLALTPRGQELEFHVNLLRHGRRTCHAQRPECPECALRRMCPYVTSPNTGANVCAHTRRCEAKPARTYLELTDPAAIRPARPVAAEIARVDPPDGAVNRRFYEGVGADHRWTDLLGRDDAWWQRHAEAVETWVIDDAGYYELEPDGHDVQVAYFGLLPAFHGRGLGGALLEHALRRGFELGSRVWLHTCTDDGPHALPNYLARGLVPFRVAR